MKYLWDNIPEIKALCGTHKLLLLLLDFDGTLSPIADSPGDALLPTATKQKLTNLNQQKNILVGVISGRQINDLKARVGIEGLIYGGNHGMEAEYFSKKFEFPLDENWFAALVEIRNRLYELSRQFPGTFVEEKASVVSFHYRNINKSSLSKFNKSFMALSKELATKFDLRIVPGKKVYNFGPDIDWHKGHLSKLITEETRKLTGIKPLTIFIGDDVTDEDAFDLLTGGINIKVGRSKHSKAEYYLSNPDDVLKFLNWVGEMRRDSN